MSGALSSAWGYFAVLGRVTGLADSAVDLFPELLPDAHYFRDCEHRCDRYSNGVRLGISQQKNRYGDVPSLIASSC